MPGLSDALPCQFMRIVAGFSGSTGDYFLARAQHEPLYDLQKLQGGQDLVDALLQGRVPITLPLRATLVQGWPCLSQGQGTTLRRLRLLAQPRAYARVRA